MIRLYLAAEAEGRDPLHESADQVDLAGGLPHGAPEEQAVEQAARLPSGGPRSVSPRALQQINL